MKVKVTTHIYYTQYSWEKEARFQVFSLKMTDSEDCTYVGEQEIEIEVPDKYDPRAQKIAVLEAKRKQVMADYQKTVDEINDRISKLQAIEYTE